MTNPTKEKLGQLLCEKSYLDISQLDQALEEQKGTRKRLGKILLDLGYVTQAQLTEALAVQVDIEYADLSEITMGRQLISLVPADLVSKYNILPLWQRDGYIAVAMTDPFDTQAIEDLRVVTGHEIERFYGNPAQMERAILKFYGSNVARMLENLAPSEQNQEEYENGSNGDYSPAKLHELARQPSLVNLVNLIILEAIEARASDVHIEPFEHQIKIKYRIDGRLIEKAPSPKQLQAAIVSRIKIMANMNIAERFVPQDGHIDFSGHKGKVDIRVSTVPSIFGESVTMRLLDKSASLYTLEELGMNQQCLKGFSRSLAKSHGIILVTGPTGSGKTTTLYAALNKIYTPSLKIITIEDPVEYQLDGIVQMQVNPKRGLSFATGLRHIVRQDPDIIMVGEIRDHETADIAIRSAMTGHLVFSTLHTNDAAGAITRLIDMGIEPFLMGSSLEMVLAQRLVRKVCSFCKERYNPEKNLLRTFNNSIGDEDNLELYHGVGCNECLNTGMRGRVGIYELLRITNQLRDLIVTKPTTEQINRAAPPDHESLRYDGIAKMLAGITTPEEILRVTQGIDEE
ncbi:MAG: Flp pilus assembly complex ATPase component TadA [Sedimentisphaerales bacterium]|nr:Flp pilus assembly complex ATPase component TadA [Sedimentisphaerales bacterium]